AADGWLAADAARPLLPASRLPALPAEILERALRRTWNVGVGDAPPGVVPYLIHPWVVANDRLRASGWSPRVDNATAIAEGVSSIEAAEHAPGRARRTVLTGVIVAAVLAARRRRDRNASGDATSASTSSPAV